MSGTHSGSRPALAVLAVRTAARLLWPRPVHVPGPSLDISQYARLAWPFGNALPNEALHEIAQTRDGCLWAGKVAAEALRNVYRPAHASRVDVEIRYDRQQFRLRVRDDGPGIDPKVLANRGLEGHSGLRGMPERAALIGGKLAVWSEVGAGTELELRLPARSVYTSSPKRSWWSRLVAPETPANLRGDPA